MERSKRPALLALGRVLRDMQIPYAIIGGLALQVHQREPRTTLAAAVRAAEEVMLEDIPLRVIRVADLLEEYPELERELTDDERRILTHMPE